MRVLLRLLSPLFGLAVAAAGALVALEVAWAWIRPNGRPSVVPWTTWRTELQQTSWENGVVLGVAVAALVLGLVLLLISAAARRRAVALKEPAEEVTMTTSPRALARLVGQRVRATEGVRSASVNATKRRIRVRASSRLKGESELAPTLTNEVRELVSSLPMTRPPRVQVVVDSSKDRS